MQWQFRKIKRDRHKHISHRYNRTSQLSKTSLNSIFWGSCSFRFLSWRKFFLYSCVGNCLVAHFCFCSIYGQERWFFGFYFPTVLHKLLHKEKYSKYHVRIRSDKDYSVFFCIKTPKQTNQPKIHTTKSSCL